MSENNLNTAPKNDEIDLLDLFKRIGRSISRSVNAVSSAILVSIIFLIRKWLPLCISLVVGIGVSYILKSTYESLFSADMVVRNNIIANADMISYISRLHSFCKEENYTTLSDALSLKPENVNNIIDINAYWIIDKGHDGIPDKVDYSNRHNVYDTIDIRMSDRFDIRVKTKSPQVLSLLKNGIMSFVKKDSLFQQRNRVRIRQNREMLKRLDYDILQLDSLQKVKYFEETRNNRPQNGGQMIFLQEQKTQLVYADIYGLYARKQTLESERDLNPDILTVLSDFNLPAKPDNGILYYGKFIIPIFFIITLVLLIILENWNKLKEVYMKY
jgi:hypothetical protein